MKQKSTNRMENKFRGNAIKLLMVLALTGTTMVNAQRAATPVVSNVSSIEEDPFNNEKNTPGTGTPIRNVVVTPICPTISALNMVDMGYDKALVAWTNTLNFDSILFRFTATGSGISRIVMIPGTPNPGRYFIQGLLSQTTYDIEVSTVCVGGGSSAWSAPLQVTTLIEPGPRFSNQRNTNMLNINPNPATTLTSISFMASSNMPQQVLITNATGQVFYKNSILPNADKVQLTVDVSAFPTGIYFVKVSNNNGISVERLIVQ